MGNKIFKGYTVIRLENWKQHHIAEVWTEGWTTEWRLLCGVSYPEMVGALNGHTISQLDEIIRAKGEGKPLCKRCVKLFEELRRKKRKERN